MSQPSRRTLANALRFLAADAVQLARSGHAGMPMGMADIAEVLWNDFLSHNPRDPNWFNRDRFVLSNGHGSMLQYALLHLSGYDLSIDDLKKFRQLESKTPGHPEKGATPGIETTTGPLGQGFANAVGFALAEKLLAQRYNRPEYAIIDHRTWVFVGDGCLMEGISHEAASLAGTWKLNKLVAFWDDNQISIDGDTQGWFTDDTAQRFRAYGWHVITNVDGHDALAIKQAIADAMAHEDGPTLICCRTVIGFGAPSKAGTVEAHGNPLGDKELSAMRTALLWPHAPFEITKDIYDNWRAVGAGTVRQAEWEKVFTQYAQHYPTLAKELQRRIHGQLPETFSTNADAYITHIQSEKTPIATRQASQRAIQAYAPLLPEIVGGSADLTHSNLTLWKGGISVNETHPDANYVYYGVREFGMSAISNGLALHGGFIPFDATFLVFSDYARNAVRMSALMSAQVIHVYTHDSIAIGEDGPTHQPTEHLNSLRDIPNNDVWRPCDSVESACAWKAALLRNNGPSCLIFTRQVVPQHTRTQAQVELIARGGYILAEASDQIIQMILISTGSEVSVALEAREQLEKHGISTRVVSMPSTSVFIRQDETYRQTVLPPSVRNRIAIEAGATSYWYRFVGLDGAVVGIDTFGASAPAPQLAQHFGITAEKVVEIAKTILNQTVQCAHCETKQPPRQGNSCFYSS